jgi:hypothetical protein
MPVIVTGMNGRQYARIPNDSSRGGRAGCSACCFAVMTANGGRCERGGVGLPSCVRPCNAEEYETDSLPVFYEEYVASDELED